MSRTDLNDVVRYRMLTTAALRLIAIWLVALEFVPTLAEAIRYLWYMTYRSNRPNSIVIGDNWAYFWSATGKAIALLLVAIFLIMYARHLARRIIPVGASRCPGCDYNLSSAKAPICPECGLHLGPDFHAPPPSKETSCEPDRSVNNVVRNRMLTAVVLRLMGIWLLASRIVPLVAQAVTMYWEFIAAPQQQGFSTVYELSWMWGNFVQAFLLALVGLVLIIYARRLARRIIPIALHRCPGCDYDLGTAPPARCPECGLFLGEGFHTPTPVGENRATDPAKLGQ